MIESFRDIFVAFTPVPTCIEREQRRFHLRRSTVKEVEEEQRARVEFQMIRGEEGGGGVEEEKELFLGLKRVEIRVDLNLKGKFRDVQPFVHCYKILSLM
jgi:FKBP-type peptidyl-prolyl cis-trans isomerase (trigger factor)